MSSLWVLYLILQLTILNKSVPKFACWEVCFVNKMDPDIYVNGRETESNQKRFRCRGWRGGGQVGTSPPNFESNLWSRSQLYTQFPWQSDTFLWGYWEGSDLWMILMGHFQMGSEPRAQKEGREPKKKKRIFWWKQPLNSWFLVLFYLQDFHFWKENLKKIIIKSWRGLSWWLRGKESTCQCRRHGFQPWLGKTPTCCGTTKPVHHSYWACALEPENCNYWAHMLQLSKPGCPRALFPSKRSHRSEKSWQCN